MSKRRRWRVVGYDGAGERILARADRSVSGDAVDDGREHRLALIRMLEHDERQEQDRLVRSALGLNVH